MATTAKRTSQPITGEQYSQTMTTDLLCGVELPEPVEGAPQQLHGPVVVRVQHGCLPVVLAGVHEEALLLLGNAQVHVDLRRANNKLAVT